MPIIERNKGFFSFLKKKETPFNRVEEPKTITETTAKTPQVKNATPLKQKPKNKLFLTFFLAIVFNMIGIIVFLVTKKSNYTSEIAITDNSHTQSELFEYTESSDSVTNLCLDEFNYQIKINSGFIIFEDQVNPKEIFFNEYFSKVAYIRTKMKEPSFERNFSNYSYIEIEFNDGSNPLIINDNSVTTGKPKLLFELAFKDGKLYNCKYNNVDLNKLDFPVSTIFFLTFNSVFTHITSQHPEVFRPASS